MEMAVRFLALFVAINLYCVHTSDTQVIEKNDADDNRWETVMTAVDTLNGRMKKLTKALNKATRKMSRLQDQLEKYKNDNSLKKDNIKFDVIVAMISTDEIELQMSRKGTYNITDFFISYTKGHGAAIHRKRVAADPVTRLSLSSLESETEYSIYIQAYDSSKLTVEGDPASLHVTTDKEVPTVFKVEVKNTTTSSILLGFQLTAGSAAVTDFDISCDCQMMSAGTVPVGHDFEITSLKSDTEYTIKVTAYNRNELGFIGNPVTLNVATAYFAPQLRVLSLTCCSVFIEASMQTNVAWFQVAIYEPRSHTKYSTWPAALSNGQLLFPRLLENATYEIGVRAYDDYMYNHVGRSSHLTIATKHTDSDIRIMPLVIQSSEAVFYVDAAPALKVNSFSIKFSRTGHPESDTQSVLAEKSRGDFNLTNLQPNTEYAIFVDAVAEEKIVISSNITVTTPSQFPADDVPEVRVGRITDESIELFPFPAANVSVSQFRIISAGYFFLNTAAGESFKMLISEENTVICATIQAMQNENMTVGSPYIFCGRTKSTKNVCL